MRFAEIQISRLQFGALFSAFRPGLRRRKNCLVGLNIRAACPAPPPAAGPAHRTIRLFLLTLIPLIAHASPTPLAMSCFRLPAQREMLTAELVQGYLADIKTPLSEFTCVCARKSVRTSRTGASLEYSGGTRCPPGPRSYCIAYPSHLSLRSHVFRSFIHCAAARFACRIRATVSRPPRRWCRRSRK